MEYYLNFIELGFKKYNLRYSLVSLVIKITYN